jgi:hypothetical protein
MSVHCLGDEFVRNCDDAVYASHSVFSPVHRLCQQGTNDDLAVSSESQLGYIS